MGDRVTKMLVGLGLRGFLEREPFGVRTGKSQLVTDLDFPMRSIRSISQPSLGTLGPSDCGATGHQASRGHEERSLDVKQTESSLRSQLHHW